MEEEEEEESNEGMSDLQSTLLIFALYPPFVSLFFRLNKFSLKLFFCVTSKLFYEKGRHIVN